MNADSIKSALAQLLTATLAMLTAVGVIDSGQANSITSSITAVFSSVATIVPAVLLLLNIAGSVYRHWNMKKVPDTDPVVTRG